MYTRLVSSGLARRSAFCQLQTPGGPRQYQSVLGFKLVDKPNQRIFLNMGSGNHNFRIIYMMAAQTGLVTGDDDNPLYFGRTGSLRRHTGSEHHRIQ